MVESLNIIQQYLSVLLPCLSTHSLNIPYRYKWCNSCVNCYYLLPVKKDLGTAFWEFWIIIQLVVFIEISDKMGVK